MHPKSAARTSERPEDHRGEKSSLYCIFDFVISGLIERRTGKEEARIEGRTPLILLMVSFLLFFVTKPPTYTASEGVQ